MKVSFFPFLSFILLCLQFGNVTAKSKLISRQRTQIEIKDLVKINAAKFESPISAPRRFPNFRRLIAASETKSFDIKPIDSVDISNDLVFTSPSVFQELIPPFPMFDNLKQTPVKFLESVDLGFSGTLFRAANFSSFGFNRITNYNDQIFREPISYPDENLKVRQLVVFMLLLLLFSSTNLQHQVLVETASSLTTLFKVKSNRRKTRMLIRLLGAERKTYKNQLSVDITPALSIVITEDELSEDREYRFFRESGAAPFHSPSYFDACLSIYDRVQVTWTFFLRLIAAISTPQTLLVIFPSLHLTIYSLLHFFIHHIRHPGACQLPQRCTFSSRNSVTSHGTIYFPS